MNELTDFCAGILIQIGSYLKVKKHSTGWLLSLVAIAYWIARAHTTGFQSQMFWHGISFALALFGYISWRKK